ncbi:hypothetical protein BSKO_09408 [Bryopsis sp. KO-2023]|nr:hypothetical protein BSKO_09408 [Bryopsis sp. KO-2023]
MDHADLFKEAIEMDPHFDEMCLVLSRLATLKIDALERSGLRAPIARGIAATMSCVERAFEESAKSVISSISPESLAALDRELETRNRHDAPQENRGLQESGESDSFSSEWGGGQPSKAKSPSEGGESISNKKDENSAMGRGARLDSFNGKSKNEAPDSDIESIFGDVTNIMAMGCSNPSPYNRGRKKNASKLKTRENRSTYRLRSRKCGPYRRDDFFTGEEAMKAIEKDLRKP